VCDSSLHTYFPLRGPSYNQPLLLHPVLSLSLSLNKSKTGHYFCVCSSRLHHWLPLSLVPIFTGQSS
jgi:hypothetical protein